VTQEIFFRKLLWARLNVDVKKINNSRLRYTLNTILSINCLLLPECLCTLRGKRECDNEMEFLLYWKLSSHSIGRIRKAAPSRGSNGIRVGLKVKTKLFFFFTCLPQSWTSFGFEKVFLNVQRGLRGGFIPLFSLQGYTIFSFQLK
jgi:hypothetical protein